MIAFAEFRLQIAGLQIDSVAEFDAFQQKLLDVVRAAHPNLRFDSDVEIEVETAAGRPAEGWPAGRIVEEIGAKTPA